MTRLNSKWIKEFKEIERTPNGLVFRYVDIKGKIKPRHKDHRINQKLIDDKAQSTLWKTLRKRELLTFKFWPLLKDLFKWIIS